MHSEPESFGTVVLSHLDSNPVKLISGSQLWTERECVCVDLSPTRVGIGTMSSRVIQARTWVSHPPVSPTWLPLIWRPQALPLETGHCRPWSL